MTNRRLRALDLGLLTLGAPVWMPVMLACALAVAIGSGRPIFFRQERVGRSGVPFQVMKFRSMRVADDLEQPTADSITRVGALLRRTSLDELPQLLNVLRGDMSLVGPRPERPELIEQFKEEIPHYNARHNIKPGITGWAQVNGLRGDTDLTERVRFDLHYIENWNVIFDFQIMVLTIFKREGAC